MAYQTFELATYRHHRAALSDALNTDLKARITALEALANLTGQTVVSDHAIRRKILTVIQENNPHQAEPTFPMIYRRIISEPWNVFFHVSTQTATKLVLMMIGAIDQQTLHEYYAWPVSTLPGAADVFAGRWTADVDNQVDMNWNGAQANYYDNGKHFDLASRPNEGKYNQWNKQTVLRIVGGLEAKAVQYGFGEQERFFMFDRVVGTDGAPNQADSRAIRVDNPGGATQHSHPIPEEAEAIVNHRGKVFFYLKLFTQRKNLNGLVDLAKYLTRIGAAPGSYVPSNNEKRDYKYLRPPGCVYWEW